MSPVSQVVRPFVAPSRVLSGSGTSSSVASELRALGVRPRGGPVVVVADAAVARLGLIEPALSSLHEAGFAVELGPPVNSEPTPATIRALKPEDLGRPIGAVVAVGGGSALDAAKLTALVQTNPELDLENGLLGTADAEPGPPMVAIPTTAGTGAEATAVAMLWNDGRKLMFVHPLLVPRAAVLDPELLRELPPAVTAAGGMDAISHAVESLLSTYRTPLTENAAREALTLLRSSVIDAYSGGGIEARYGSLLGAYHAGLALNASVVLGHSMAYVVSAHADLPHGVTCAMALPYCVAHARRACERQIAEVAGIVCGSPDADRLVPWLVRTNARLGIPASLADVGIDRASLAEMAAETVAIYPRPNHPVALHGIEQLYSRFHDGDAEAAWVDATQIERVHA